MGPLCKEQAIGNHYWQKSSYWFYIANQLQHYENDLTLVVLLTQRISRSVCVSILRKTWHQHLASGSLMNPCKNTSHICASQLSHHWFRWWLVTYLVPSHYINQWQFIVNWTIWNKLQWNFNQNTKIFITEKSFENIVCKMATILSRPHSVRVTSRMVLVVVAWRVFAVLAPVLALA